MGERFSGTCIKYTRAKPMGLGSSVGHGGGWVGGCVEGKMETTILEQQFTKYKIRD